MRISRRLFALVLLLLPGCKMLPVRHIAQSPAVSVGGQVPVEIKGDSKTAPNVTNSQTGSKMVIPEGSKFVFDEKLNTLTLVMSKASEIAVNRSETAIKGPVAFTPDKGPTVGEEKSAQADFWTVLGLRAGIAIGIAMAIFGLVRHWDLVMYGGAAVAGACLFGIFVQQHPLLLLVIGLGIAAAIVGPTIYHTKIKKLDQPPDATK